MEGFIKDVLLSSEGVVAYASIFGVLVACGLGVPLPEDISLIVGGFLAHEGAVRLPIMMAVGFWGILAGDTLIYVAGRRVGTRAVGHGFLARVVTPAKRVKVERLFAAHGQKIVMIARFLPGVRAVTYFTAGSARMGYGRFIVWDGLAALASAPLLVYLGYRFGAELEFVVRKLRDGELVLVAAVAVLAFALWAIRRRRAAQLLRAEPKSAAEPLAPRSIDPASGPSVDRADSSAAI